MIKNLIAIVMIAAFSATFVHASQIIKNETVIESEVEVIVPFANVQSAASNLSTTVATARQGDVLSVFGMIENYYVVMLKNGTVGLIERTNTKVSKLNEAYLVQKEGDNETDFLSPNSLDSADALFMKINESRQKNGQTPYAYDEKLNYVAQIKAEDLVENNYFSHYSKKYKTPFNMLKSLGISYNSASENIYANNSIENAHISGISTPSKRTNLLSSNFEKVGIGVAKSEKYGMIIVEVFISDTNSQF